MNKLDAVGPAWRHVSSTPGITGLLTSISDWRNWRARRRKSKRRGQRRPLRPPAPAVELRDNWRTVICPVDLSPQAIRALFDHWLAPPECPKHVAGMVRFYDSPDWEDGGFVTRRMATDYVRDCHFLVGTLANKHGWTDFPDEPPEPHEGKRPSENPWPHWAHQAIKAAWRYLEPRLKTVEKHGGGENVTVWGGVAPAHEKKPVVKECSFGIVGQSNEVVPPDSTESRAEVLRKLRPAERKAFLSYEHAERRAGRALRDADAHKLLQEHGFCDDRGDAGELTDYELPEFETWSRQLRSARSRLGASKYTRRASRAKGRSVVNAKDL